MKQQQSSMLLVTANGLTGTKLTLPAVYLNDLHSLKRLHLQNVTPTALSVRLRTSLPALAFQLSNENLPDGGPDEAQGSVAGQPFNQLFNEVRYVSSVNLGPHERRSVVLTFMPGSNGRLERQASTIEGPDADGSFEFADVNGSLFFEVTPSIVSHDHDSVSETIALDFEAHVCRSVLWSEVLENGGIQFDDCLVDGTYYKDFNVWNQSEIELHWQMALDAGKYTDWFRLLDHDSGAPFDAQPIASFSYRRVRIEFKPLIAADIHLELYLDNLNDYRNSETVRSNIIVRTSPRPKSLVFNRTALDFGNCYTGEWSRQMITIKNVTDQPIELHFASTLGRSVVVDLKLGDTTRSMDSLLPDDNTSVIEPWASRDMSAPPSTVGSGETSPSMASLYESDHESTTSSFEIDNATRPSISRADSNVVEDQVAPSEPSRHPHDYVEIEDLLINAGAERVVYVCFQPNVTRDAKAGQLSKLQFRLELAFNAFGSSVHETKSIPCRARVCSSLVEVQPKELNYGDVDVGTLKSMPVHITNLSDLPALIELRFSSKVLNCFQDPLEIPPRQSIDVRLDIFPRKVNANYCKQIGVANLHNRDNDQTLLVRSNNVDKNRVTFHSLFYRIWTPTFTSYIDYGVVVLNSPTIRSCSIENISKAPLTLEISSSLPEEVLLYTIATTEGGKERQASSAITTSVERRERILEAMERPLAASGNNDYNSISAIGSTTTSSAGTKTAALPEFTRIDSFTTDYLDLASSGGRDVRSSPRKLAVAPRRVKTPASRTVSQTQVAEAPPKRDPNEQDDAIMGEGSKPVVNMESTAVERPHAEHSNRQDPQSPPEAENSLEHLLNQLAALNEQIATGLGGKQPFEEKFVKFYLHIQRQMDQAVRDGRLVPVHRITIAPESRRKLVMIFTPLAIERTHIVGSPRKIDVQLNFRMIDFDRNADISPEFSTLLQSDSSVIPVREMLIRASLCRSTMEIGQRNINFGLVAKKEKRTKSIVIYNRSEAPLIYAVRKSGSIASGDLYFSEGRMGVIRSFGKREVDFMFNPSLPGLYQERIVIENVQDRSNDQSVTVKAQVRKPSHFFIKSLAVDFGACVVDEWTSTSQSITVINTSKKNRLIEIRYEPDDFRDDVVVGGIKLDLAAEESAAPLSKEAEEAIEQLEQKLKIAIRKGRQDKIDKIKAKLSELKGGQPRSVESSGASTAERASNQTTAETITTSQTSLDTQPVRQTNLLLMLGRGEEDGVG